MTMWWPDTCGCQIEINDDSGETKKHVIACPAHSANTHQEVLQENQRKNYVHGDVRDSHPGKEFTWSFDPDRTLVITFKASSAPTSAEISALQQKVQPRGKVRFEIK